MRLALLLSLAVLLAPLAAAGAQPALYFLKDGETGPVGNGVLNQTAPDSLNASVRPVLPGTSDLPSAEWRLAEPPTQRVWGPVLAYVWPGPSAVGSGNLTATLYAVDGSTRTILGSASVNIDTNTSEAPDPLSFIPPDPSDPEGAVAYIAAKVLAETLQPPLVLNLGVLDVAVPEGQELGIGFYMEAPDGSPLPLPVGVGSLQYDGMLSPSFLYVSWYVEDPESSTTSSTSSTTTTSSSSGPVTSAPEDDAPVKKKSPGPGVAVVLVGLAGAAVAVRRRL